MLDRDGFQLVRDICVGVQRFLELIEEERADSLGKEGAEL
jgi:hypothetical protein